MSMTAEKRKILKSPARRNLPQISDAELVVMKVVWGNPPVTANQVVEALAGQAEWKPKTIHTLLSRLVHKGAVTYEKKGREYLFSPRIDAGDFVHEASRSFLRRVFDGEIAPFLACFLERENLSPAEIEKLRRLLDEKES
jgi:BlaI family penicillinase repressor